MPGVVSDSSTLIHLAGIGRLQLLHDLFGSLTLPTAVWREVVLEGRGRAGAREVEEAQRAGWIHVRQPADSRLLRILESELDDGETEAITLAIEINADLILVDEMEARRIAELYDLRKTGVIGLLLQAKREGRVTSLRNELDMLRQRSGFRIADALYEQALKEVGE